MNTVILLKLVIVTFTMQFLPGWALLSLGGYWKKLSTIQRWIVLNFFQYPPKLNKAQPGKNCIVKVTMTSLSKITVFILNLVS